MDNTMDDEEKIYPAPPCRPTMGYVDGKLSDVAISDGEYLQQLENCNMYTKDQCMAIVSNPNLTGKELAEIGYPTRNAV